MNIKTNTNIREAVIAFIRDHHGNQSLEIDETTNLIQIGYLDSAAVMNLLMYLEDEFDADIDLLEHDPAELLTVAGLTKAAKASI